MQCCRKRQLFRLGNSGVCSSEGYAALLGPFSLDSSQASGLVAYYQQILDHSLGRIQMSCTLLWGCSGVMALLNRREPELGLDASPGDPDH